MLAKMQINLAAALAAALLVPVTAGAQTSAVPKDARSSKTATTAAGNVISSHQIDRYEAIRQLQDALRSDPNNLADWVILGELAQEVATEVPAEESRNYYRTASEAYENALKIQPNNQALQAAVRFARDQESDAPRFDQARRQASTSYLEARRREFSERGPSPTVRVYNAPAPVASQPNQPNQPAPYGNPQPYGAPTYRPYTNASGEPYTYNQYSNGYFPRSAQPGANNLQPGQAIQPGQANAATQPPQTLRQFTQQLPNVLMNEAAQRATGAPAVGAPVTPR